MRLSITQITLALLLIFASPAASFAQLAGSEGPAAAPSASPSGEFTTGAALVGDPQYVLGVGDVIEVAVVGRADFTGRAKIGADGAVLLPLLGAVPAADRTPGQLGDQIRDALKKGGYFANPVVRVDVVGVASRYVTVLGAVGTPGLIPLDRKYRLSEILARVGGKGGAGVDEVILTPQAGQPKHYKVADLATASGDQDPVVNSGDKIYVPAAEAQVFYVTGQVKNPGSYPVVEGMTVRMALARAGGLTDSGSDKKVKITRKGADIRHVKVDTTPVQAADIIDVGERLF